MVDSALLARKVAAVRDAVARIRAVLPGSAERFLADRTAREVVVLNLFVALQECLSLATHWLADEGRKVPESYRETFLELSQLGVLDPKLAARLAAASGLRNLIAHQYGALDPGRIYDIASLQMEDFLAFCATLARRAGPEA